ncbi:MAG: trypsin-like peptidase domain-containing protein [Candidatus Eisenbacteria bacterium]|uniref:Trypsin-like peptidase domain-containing protein n=1 Tax=Eiseniibacteriota bacterium TaxID=2212470 RepID=A0A948RVL0_UNCEI|nr:trypsin-like peptidase domain-containing protein [Candidatus Eisenbacteria bacterium]MBU1947294.1 trypsin-like peptidase domain-containing protein [Candidatus Eisenbacteria bacterium]MBU2691833.1 trypsin-like peptidase domain-containing protein [Candidatus Eisenbacteria bacterium]
MSRLPLGSYLGAILLLLAALGLGVGLFWGIGRLESDAASNQTPIKWGLWLSEGHDSTGLAEKTTPRVGFPLFSQKHTQPDQREMESPVWPSPDSRTYPDETGISEAPGRSPFVAVAEKVLPAVVNIDAERLFRHGDLGGSADDPMRQLFPELEGEEIEIPSTGSGFLISSQGYVVTNFHVVYDAQNISVTLADGSSHDAELVGADPPSDIAVLKIAAGRDLPYVELGNAEDLKIGDWVAAIGNPFGNLEGTLTVGVVSAKGRNELAIAGGSPVYQDFIQTDASINFGNSGGPLVNTRGEVVGINTAFNAPGRGISFAISMRMAERIISDLITNGHVIRGYLGVTLQALDSQLAEAWGLEGRTGVIVSDVIDGTPASDAGFQAGDVLLQFDGKPVLDVQPFRLLVAQTLVEKKVEVIFWRDGKIESTHVVLAERPDVVAALHPTQPESQEPASPESTGDRIWDLLGVAVDMVADGPGGERSLQVIRLRITGPAFRAGIREGDFLVEADNTFLGSGMDDLAQALERAHQGGKAMILRVFRNGAYSYIAITPDQP